MGVVMFAKVRCYQHGFHVPPIDYALNVGQVVGFFQRSFKDDDEKMVSFVALETASRNQLAIEGTLDDLFAAFKDAEASTKRAWVPYIQGK